MRIFGVTTTAVGARPCSVCGRRLAGAVYQLPDGRTWCVAHASSPRCTACAIPVETATGGDVLCVECGRTVIRRSADIVPIKDELKRRMKALGIEVNHPTRIKLVDSSAAMSGDPHVQGTTSWARTTGARTSGPITIQMLRGLPVAHFRHVMGHEFAHAAMVGSPGMNWLGPRLVEGFAEALALTHVRDVGDPGLAVVEASMLANPDPVYGDGLRLVLPAVERHGLSVVLEALRWNIPDDVGLPRR